MSTSFSPSRNPGSTKLQLGVVSRLRSSSLKKPPEPLRRAVADWLSSSSSSHHGSPSTVVSEASRILRDYLLTTSTTDLAYNVILEHTLAERERSPAVVARCVALLKRYILRYKPSEETLQRVDRFCANIIAECGYTSNQRAFLWPQHLNQQSSTSSSSAVSPRLPVSSFASEEVVKSLNFVRSLIARHIPRRSFQPAVFSGPPNTSRQSLPTLSSLLSRSFNSQLSPANNGESSENKDASAISTLNLSNIEEEEGNVFEDLEYIAVDVLKWRWSFDRQSSFLPTESYHDMNPQDISTHSFLEVGAAALLVGDMETKMKDQPWRQTLTAEVAYVDQLLQPSSVTTATNFSSARPHLRAITASKRTKPGTLQIWEDVLVSTFRPRARPLFQYRYYSEQQPLRLNPTEVHEVITAVCAESSSPNSNVTTLLSRFNSNSGTPSMDVAVSVLIKLVIDMYVLDSGIAAPLTLSMLEEMLTSTRLASKARAFDLILNLGVHAHLLEPLTTDDTPTIDEEYESYFDNGAQLPTQGKRKPEYFRKFGNSSAIDKFESWILGILYEILLLLVQTEEKDESVWASALSCLLYFVCDRGKIWRNRLKGLDIRVIRMLLEISRINSWAEVVHCKLICMLANMFYQVPEGSSSPVFLVDQIDVLGGVDFICLEYSLTNSREERRNLYLILFDYVIYQVNEACITSGVSEYSIDEIQPLATLLTLADAPEAFHITVKLGVEGIGEILARSIAAALSRLSNSERLTMLLEKITSKFDTILSSFTHLDKEFSHMIQKTKSGKYLESIGNGYAKLSWATLHSLLHSDRMTYRRNGYIWLGDLLVSEISVERNENIWSIVKSLHQKIALAGAQDPSVAADIIPLPIWIMCGLLKSKHNYIRWGFLFVLERLLVRCKFLLDEDEIQHSNSIEVVGEMREDVRLDKANAVIDIMSSALSLVVQINETDRINILKMSDILFSQLCLKAPSKNAKPFKEVMHLGSVVSFMDENKKGDLDEDAYIDENGKFTSGNKNNYPLFCETSSMAALLLQGKAFVPMQLISRVPAALFYWPLIQLAGAATDDIALGVAVGSKGRGNLPGGASDIRATLLLLLIGKCTVDPAAFREVGGEEFFRELLDDTDSRVAYFSSAFLLKRMMTEEPVKYQRMLQNLVFKAQQSNNEKLLENPYLQMRGIIQLSNDLGIS